MESVMWYCSLIIGLIFFVWGIVTYFQNKDNRGMAFAKMSIKEIVAAWIMIFPGVLMQEARLTFLGFIKSILLSLLDVLIIFSGNGFFEMEIKGGYIFEAVYTIVLSLVNLSVMISLIGFVLQFLGGFIEEAILESRKYEKVFLFSEMNEKTLSIARSIRDNKENGKKTAIAFMDSEQSEINKSRAKELKAYCLDVNISKEIFKLQKRASKIDVFVFGKSEEDNLSKLNEIAKIDFSSAKGLIRVYVELTETSWGIYDNFVKNNKLPADKILVNLVDCNENFILNDLFDHSVFENTRADGEKGREIIDVLIVGTEKKSMEMIKSLLHLCQMPGYELKITVLDSNDKTAVIKQMIPEIKKSSDEEGDSIYSLKFLKHIKYDTLSLEKAVKRYCPEFTFAFICTGNNIDNINISLRINTFRRRENNGDNYFIQVCADNNYIMENWADGIRDNILLVGGLEYIYNYEFITLSNIEKAAQAVHEIRQRDKRLEREKKIKEIEEKEADGNKEKLEPYKEISWIEYSNDEYKRHSVYARTLSLKYKTKLLKKRGLGYDTLEKDLLWMCYEHMRWNMYTRSIGYINTDKTNINSEKITSNDRIKAKTHPCLVSWDELSEEEKLKDGIKLTEDIVKVFEDIQ